jgi:hypothetical protein
MLRYNHATQHLEMSICGYYSATVDKMLQKMENGRATKRSNDLITLSATLEEVVNSLCSQYRRATETAAGKRPLGKNGIPRVDLSKSGPVSALHAFFLFHSATLGLLGHLMQVMSRLQGQGLGEMKRPVAHTRIMYYSRVMSSTAVCGLQFSFVSSWLTSFPTRLVDQRGFVWRTHLVMEQMQAQALL